jgi:hypothetical protein
LAGFEQTAMIFSAENPGRVGFTEMHMMPHTLYTIGTIFAALITIGVGILIFCCLTCSNCGCKEKDELFRRKSA